MERSQISQGGSNSLEEEEEELLLQHKQMTGTISKLPIDIILDILSRVPIKSLSQCRWVCKPWYNLIRHPRFTLVQHARSMKRNSASLILETVIINSHFIVDHQVFDSLQTLTPIYQVLYGQKDSIVGSCNGLLCMSSEPFYVCNPITGDQMTLPTSPKNEISSFVSGFGFDPVSNEYKLVRIMKKKNRRRRFEAEVYTLGSGNDWRSIPKVPYVLDDTLVKYSVFLRGALHWLGYKYARIHGCLYRSKIIVSFKVGEEKFEEILLPSGLHIKNANSYLGVLGECLCLVDGSSSEYIETWTMEEYGVRSSWRKQYIIKYEPMGGRVGMAYDLIRVMKNGEISLLYNNDILGYYNSEKETFTPISIQGVYSRIRCVHPIVHLESLLSLKNVTRLKNSDYSRLCMEFEGN